jgi:hypothetical protein
MMAPHTLDPDDRTPTLANLLATVPGQVPVSETFGAFATPSTGATPSGGSGQVVIAFCSDEDIARRCAADFATLCGDSQMLARGTDGTFAGASLGDPWTMSSASINFATQGVMAGDVLHLVPPRIVGTQATYPAIGQLLAIDTVTGNPIRLRRIGLASGLGDPPTVPGTTGSYRFTVPTLYPQILDASYDLRRIYGLDELVWGRRTSDLYDLMQFVEPCVYQVLTLRYLEMARSAGEGAADDFVAKSDQYRARLDSLLDRLVIHFKPSPLPMADLTRFQTRIVR